MPSTKANCEPEPSSLRRAAPLAAFIVTDGVAWVATIWWARDMGNGPGTMSLGWTAFLGVWAVMMAAMMLPSVWKVASAEQRPSQPVLFAVGYLSVWAAAGLPALAIAAGAGRLTEHHAAIATGLAATIFVICGLHQFSSAKAHCLAECRPQHHGKGLAASERTVEQLWHGVTHSAWCVGCSWAAMALLIPFGVMNVGAMVVLAIFVYAERSRFGGKLFVRLAGAASFGCGLLVVINPGFAPGLHHVASAMRM